jgi:hypothetical protein
VRTTAFITPCWKRWRGPELLALLLTWWLALPVAAQVPVEASNLSVERDGDAVLLSTTVKFELSPSMEDALLKGVALVFVAEAEVVRERWYWTNKRVAQAQRQLRLAYQPLTGRWRLNVANGPANQQGTGMTLNQTFDSLGEALNTLRRLYRWRIADAAEIEPDQRHWLDFRFHLDTNQLPRPFQIGTLGQSEWTLEWQTEQALRLDAAR